MDIDVKMEEKKPIMDESKFFVSFLSVFLGGGVVERMFFATGCCLLHSKDKQKLKIQDF